MDGIFAYQNGSAAGAAQTLDIHSSLPELKNDTRDIAQTIWSGRSAADRCGGRLAGLLGAYAAPQGREPLRSPGRSV